MAPRPIAHRPPTGPPAPAAVAGDVRANGESGYTLAELLLAMAITTTIFLAAAMTLVAGLRSVSPKPGEDPNADPRVVGARRIDQASALALALPADVHGAAPAAIVTDGASACPVTDDAVTLLTITAPATSGAWTAVDYALVAVAGTPERSELRRTSCRGAAPGAVDVASARQSTLARDLVGGRTVTRDANGARAEVAGVDHTLDSPRVVVWVDADGAGSGTRTNAIASALVDPAATTTTTTVPETTTTTTTLPETTTTTTAPATTTTTAPEATTVPESSTTTTEAESSTTIGTGP
jgi:hypothetical protein